MDGIHAAPIQRDAIHSTTQKLKGNQMNTHDKIELPPLVGTLANMPEHHKAVIESYGRACALVAVKADRQRRGEPVAWIRKNGFRFIAEIEPQDDSEVPLYAAPVATQAPAANDRRVSYVCPVCAASMERQG